MECVFNTLRIIIHTILIIWTESLDRKACFLLEQNRLTICMTCFIFHMIRPLPEMSLFKNPLSCLLKKHPRSDAVPKLNELKTISQENSFNVWNCLL